MSIFSYFFKKPIDKSKLEKSRLKDYDKAINFYEETLKNNKDLKIDPYHIKSYNNRGTIKYDMGLFEDAIKDSYKRLIGPSIEREIRSELTEHAEDEATKNFSLNLEKLLMQPPMKDKMVLGFDPAYRTGCKLAIVDNTGKMLDIKVIYPHEPRNEKDKSKKILLDLIDKYNIDIIAIGNGTASRESEAFVASVIKEAKYKCEYILIPLEQVANGEKKVPLEWIKKDHTGMTEEYINYALPLIQGDAKAPLEDGLPRFAKLKKILINKL